MITISLRDWDAYLVIEALDEWLATYPGQRGTFRWTDMVNLRINLQSRMPEGRSVAAPPLRVDPDGVLIEEEDLDRGTDTVPV